MAEETTKNNEFVTGGANQRIETNEKGEEEVVVDTGKTDADIRKESLSKYEIENRDHYSGRYRAVNEEAYKSDTDSTYKGGFYYDTQLEDPYLSMSLHANTKIVDGEWVEWPGEHLEPIDNEKGSKWSKCYGVQPIARCIMSEDFSYSIVNNFSDYNSGNPVEDLFSAMKPYAPIMEKLGKGLGDAVENTGTLGSDVVSWLSKYAKKASGLMKTTGGYLNKALFVQGSRFTYYNGTQFNFNNMEMKFVVFSDYVTTNGVYWKFQSVEDYIKTLQPYVMGIYSPYNADFLANTDFQGEAKKFIQEYVGFQDPPGGFHMDTKALGNALQGTLRLNIGGTWAIDNLVIKGMNVSMSRVQAKDPEHPGETVPLYAEISLQLSPAAAIVDTGYRSILDHGGLGKLRGQLSSGYSKKLNRLKDSYLNN